MFFDLKKKMNLLEVEILCYIINVLTFTFDQFNE